MNDFTLTILLISIVVQLVAAIFALRLNRKISGVGYAWLVIAAALTLMAIRRIITFLGFFAPQVEMSIKGPVAESIALLIALLMLFGVLLIPRIFQSLQQTTEALQVSDSRYRTLVDSAEDVIFSVDRDGRYTNINANALRRFGWVEADFVGKTVRDFYPPEVAAFYEEKHAQVFKSGQPVRFERESKNELGNFWFSVSLSPIFNASGKVVAISGISRDITKRRQAEMVLETRVRQQAVVAQLGQMALANPNISTLMDEAVTAIHQSLEVEYVKVLQLSPDGDTLLLRTGVGWQDGLVGNMILDASAGSQAGYTLLSSTPVIVKDMGSETRFSGPQLLIDHHVISGVSVIIPGEARPFGILGAHTIQQRLFTDDDVYFLQAVANILAETIKGVRLFEAVQATLRQSETLLTATQALSRTVNLPDVFELILNELQQVVPYDSASIQQLKGNHLEIIGGRGLLGMDNLLSNAFDLSAGKNPNQEVIRTKAPVIVNDVATLYKEFSIKLNPQTAMYSWLGVPLLFGDHLIGTLALGNRAPGFYTEEHAHLVSGFAAQAAIAIENAQLFDTAIRRTNELAVLIRLGYGISANLDLETILESAYKGVGELMDNDAFWISAYEADSEYSQYLIKIDKGVHYPLDQFSINTGVGGKAIRSGKPILMDQLVTQNEYPAARYGDAEPVNSVLCVPLWIGDRIIGAMSTQSYKQYAYTQSDLDLLTKLGQSVALAMENARLFKAEQRRAQDLALLNNITRTAVETTDFRAMMQMMVNRLGDLLAADSCTIFLWDEEKKMTRIATTYSPLQESKPRLEAEPGEIAIAESVMQTGQPHIVEDVFTLPYFKQGKDSFLSGKSILGLPLHADNSKIGATLIIFEQPHQFTPGEIALGEQATGQIALAIAKARLFTEVQRYTVELEQRVAERTLELAEANEQLKALDRLKSKFVSDVSHELRTPVTNVNLYLDLLAPDVSEQNDRYITILKMQAGRLKQLIEDILDLSRLEMSKEMKAQFKRVNLNEVVEKVVAAHQPRADARGLLLTFDPDSDLPRIFGERNQLFQIVTNLVANALNYTEVGHIQIKTFPVFERSQVCLQVNDTGIGIKSEDLPHIFERFYRGQHGSQSLIPGTGLGLGIVKEIVDLHKGEIEVQSEVGAGSTFRVYFSMTS